MKAMIFWGVVSSHPALYCNAIIPTMRNSYLSYLYLSLFFWTFTSCTRETDTDSAIKAKEALLKSYEYYPVSIGKSWTYQTDTIYYFDNLGMIEIDTISLQIRETLSDTFRTIDNRLVYRLLKEIKDNSTGSWNITNVYSLMHSTNQLIRTEENISLIDLVFPLDQNTSWDPTALIDANTNYLVRGKGIQLFKDWPSAYIEDTYNATLFGKDRDVVVVRDVEARYEWNVWRFFCKQKTAYEI